MAGGPWGTVDDEEALFFWFYVVLVVLSIGFDLGVHHVNGTLRRLADKKDESEREEGTRLTLVARASNMVDGATARASNMVEGATADMQGLADIMGSASDLARHTHATSSFRGPSTQSARPRPAVSCWSRRSVSRRKEMARWCVWVVDVLSPRHFSPSPPSQVGRATAAASSLVATTDDTPAAAPHHHKATVYDVTHEEVHELEEAVEQRNQYDLALAVWHRFVEEMMVLGFLAFIIWSANQAGLYDLVAWRLNPDLWEGDSPSGSSGSSGSSSGSDGGSSGSDGSGDLHSSSSSGGHYFSIDEYTCPRRVPTSGAALLHASEHAHICLFVAMASYFICLQAS